MMTTTIDPTRLYYRNDILVTVKVGNQSRKLLRNGSYPLAEQTVATTSTSSLLVADDKGSVLSLFGAADERLTYTPYGYAHDVRPQRTVLGFNGEKIEASIEAYLLGVAYHRPYNLKLMRFMSPDSISPFSELNPYGYGAGDPINNIDPSGHSIVKFIQNKLFNRKTKIINRIETFNKTNKTIDDSRSKILYGRPYNPYVSYGSTPPRKDAWGIAEIAARSKDPINPLPKEPSLSSNDMKYAAKHDIEITEVNRSLATQFKNTIPLAERLLKAAEPKPQVIRNPGRAKNESTPKSFWYGNTERDRYSYSGY